MVPEPQKAPVLPPSVVGLVDIGRLIREIDKLEDSLRTADIRGEHRVAPQLPKLSQLLDDVVSQNRLDLLQPSHRRALLEFLKLLRKDAPKLHMSFSADPSPEFISKILRWIRGNLHPHALLAIGMQPGIGAGCVLRTTNKYFDMSLSKSFASSRELLMKRLKTPESQP
jgi:hypothetical protein